MPSDHRKIVILTSCTGAKQYAPDNQLVQHDFRLDPEAFQIREAELSGSMMPAELMYTGQQHKRLMRGVNALRAANQFDVDLQIVSAGYGLITGSKLIAPYECTFQTMNTHEIAEWSDLLNIPAATHDLFQHPADLIIVALGE